MKCALLFLLIVLLSLKGQTQHWDTIRLYNSSFEDTPRCCMPPSGWTDCGFKGETPPDVQPALKKDNLPFFNVTKTAFEGNTYMGMVVRENGTYESVCQRLISTLFKGKCYKFSICLCKSETYLSASNKSEPTHLKEFTTPVILRIWGGESICNRKQLLAYSPVIENTEWQKYEFQFKAEDDMNYFQLVAYYNTQVEFPYNGNLLLDNASDIIEIDCDLMDKK